MLNVFNFGCILTFLGLLNTNLYHYCQSSDFAITLFLYRNDIARVIVYDDPQSGLMVSQTKGRPLNKMKCLKNTSHQVSMLRKSLKFDDKENMVLLISIATKEMIRLCMMFPEVFFMDVAHGTNRQKRDMFVLCTKDSDGKAYTTNLTLVPSGKSWVFDTIYKEAFIHLYGETTVFRNRLAVVDEDVSEIRPFESAIKCSPTYKGSYLMICVFHAVWKPFNEEVKPLLPKNKTKQTITPKCRKYGELFPVVTYICY